MQLVQSDLSTFGHTATAVLGSLSQSVLPTGYRTDDITVMLNEWPRLDMLCASSNRGEFLPSVVFGQPSVKWFAQMQSDRCLSVCLSCL